MIRAQTETEVKPRSMRVLLVDDDQEFNLLPFRWLRRAGYDVVTALDGISAIKEAVAQPPDVVLLDLGLPAGDGFNVLQRIRKHPKLFDVPVIVISGWDAGTHKARAIALGAQAFVSKPVTSGELLAVITRTIRHSERTSAN